MPKLRTIHRCTECGGGAPRWSGRCATCGAWNTLVEEVDEARPAGGGLARTAPPERPVPLHEVDLAAVATRPTGVEELDRVLGGGLVPGSVTLLGGEPGIGKSTLLLQALSSLARRGARCLLVSAEESRRQVRLRADRLQVDEPTLWLVSETALPDILAAASEVEPDVVVVDSIQTIHDPDLGSAPGSVAQVRECAHQLVRRAKERGTAIVLVGHVTKDGSLAGPRVLEHVVDTVLSFEGDRHHALRLLRAVKHRFGPTGELGLFEMAGPGLVGVPDPSGLLLGDRSVGGDGNAAPGSVVVPAMEGNRPLLVEVQALIAPTPYPQPRRSAQGLDGGRLALLVAVLERRVGLSFTGADVYASAVGGVAVTEPAADLPLALALAGALADRPLPSGLVGCGEVGLAGEVRQAVHTPRRLAEAARLGCTRAVVPASTPSTCDGTGLELVRVATLADAVARLGLLPPQ
jgi:DNA repair protein RadA/Sms